MFHKIKDFLIRNNNSYVVLGVLVLILFIFRFYPEHVIGKLPIGFDVTTAYINTMTQIQNGTANYLSPVFILNSILSAKTFLTYSVFQIILPIFGGNIFLTLKFCGVALYIFLGLAFFYMFRKLTGRDAKESFFATLLFSTCLATLNLSWCLFRNELGLIFFFLMVACITDLTRKFNIISLILSIFYLFLVYITHELVFLLAIIVILIFIVNWILGKIKNIYLNNITMLVVCIFIFLSPLVFSLNVRGLDLFIVPEDSAMAARDTMIYFALLFTTLSFFAVIGLIYDLVKDVKYAKLLLIWFLFSVFIAVEPTLYKTQSLFLWDRWVLLMGIPIVILAYDGIKAIAESKYLKALGRDVIILLLIVFVNYSSFSFAFSKHGIDTDIPPDVAMPTTLIWNSVGQMKKENFDQAINYLSKIDSPYVLISDWRYGGLLTLGSEQLDNAKITYTTGPKSAESIVRNLYDVYDPENNEKIYVFGANELLSAVGQETVFTSADGLTVKKIDLNSVDWDKFKE